MTAIELYRSGKLQEAIQVLGDEVRSAPLDIKRRTFLFELLCFAGNFDRAEKQLDFLAKDGGPRAAGVLLYRSAIHAERTRQELFVKREYPAGETGEKPIPGSWNDQPFTELRDADPRIGSHLEVFIAGGYTWIPLQYVEQLEIEPPESLRDLIWARARIQASPAFRLQDLGEVLIPVLAPFSYQHTDDNVKLGRSTVWETPEGETEEIPFGQRLLLIDGEEVPILEIRSLEWQKSAEDAADASQ